MENLTPQQMELVLAFVKAKDFTERIKKFEDKEKRTKNSIKKYHLSDKGKIARREASKRYYQRKKAKKLKSSSKL